MLPIHSVKNSLFNSPVAVSGSVHTQRKMHGVKE